MKTMVKKIITLAVLAVAIVALGFSAWTAPTPSPNTAPEHCPSNHYQG